MFLLQVRRRIIINTDPQRRCYNGVHFSFEEQWTDWEDICDYKEYETAQSAKECFAEINPSREYQILSPE